MTNKTIAYCGLNCETCDAFIATKNNDQSLRVRTAKLWAELNQAPILPEHINCQGCRLDGAKTIFCQSLCTIRQCAIKNGFDTCGHCPDMAGCQKLYTIVKSNPKVLDNLKKATHDGN